MHSLRQLMAELSDEETACAAGGKKHKYSLLLELFLRIEDSRADSHSHTLCGQKEKKEEEFKDIFDDFQVFASTVLTADLADPAGIHYHEIILQIIALCFSNIDQWGGKTLPCLKEMLSAVCRMILSTDISTLGDKGKEKDEERMITALFSLDHSMSTLVLDEQNIFIAVYNHTLQPSNQHQLTRVYAYRGLITFLTDVQALNRSSLSSTNIINALKVPFLQDLTNTELDVRQAALLCLETFSLHSVKNLHDYSDMNMRHVLRFLRYRYRSTMFVLYLMHL